MRAFTNKSLAFIVGLFILVQFVILERFYRADRQQLAAVWGGPSQAAPVLPDYVSNSKDDAWCQAWYGPQYLAHIASHHVPYCKASSASSLECFRTHRSDSLCIANRLDISATHEMTLDCQLRNFTREKLDDHTDELGGVKNIENMNSYYFWTGVMEQTKNWTIQNVNNHGACQGSGNVENQWILLAKREANNNVWHKLMELWQVMLTLDSLQMSINPHTQQPYLTIDDLHNMQIVFEDDQDGIVDEWWSMLTGRAPTRLSQMKSGCYTNVILPLAGSTSPFWKSHLWDRNCHDTFLLDTFLRRIYQHLNLGPPIIPPGKIIVSIINRKGGKRKIVGLDAHVQRSQQRWPHVNFVNADLATMSLKEQVLLARNSNVLMGVIGAGMTHLLFLPEDSSVAEIMPPNFHYAGFRNIAKMRGLPYFTTHAEDNEYIGEHSDEETVIDIGDEDDFQAKNNKWQEVEWLYIDNSTFDALLDAAINGQLNGGLRVGDILPVQK